MPKKLPVDSQGQPIWHKSLVARQIQAVKKEYNKKLTKLTQKCNKLQSVNLELNKKIKQITKEKKSKINQSKGGLTTKHNNNIAYTIQLENEIKNLQKKCNKLEVKYLSHIVPANLIDSMILMLETECQSIQIKKHYKLRFT